MKLELWKKKLAERNRSLAFRQHNSQVKKGKRPACWEKSQTPEAQLKKGATRKKLILAGLITTPFVKGHVLTRGEKNRLWKGGIKEKECEVCGVTFKKKNTRTCSTDCRRILNASVAQGIPVAAFRGFISSERKRDHASPQNSEWRLMVFGRDDYRCQMCGEKGCYLEAHHIKKWSKYPSLRREVSNGITLCNCCHLLTKHHEEEYESLFEELITNQTTASQDNFKKGMTHRLLRKVKITPKAKPHEPIVRSVFDSRRD